MNIKSEKGITGIDISVAIIIILLFVSIIATLIYNYSTTSKEINRKSTATYMIIDILEHAKSIDYASLTNEEVKNYIATEDKFKEQGYMITSKVEDCTQLLGEEATEDILKKVTANVKYLVNGEEKELQIYTIVKNNLYVNEIPLWDTRD